jgi:2-polyprenyl-3-methyl-5-hydroxy-6-metoxy-1,4-benzoquinol methylase
MNDCEIGAKMNLAEHRQRASELSGGTSSDVIKELVLRLLTEHQIKGSLLDFGAGKGELLHLLCAQKQLRNLVGVDLFARPEHMPEEIAWHCQDLNDNISIDETFDAVICSEVIEHLENPRHTFRNLIKLLRPGGTLILTMPNQESIRSYVGLIFGGHFVQFLGNCYPAHITSLLRLDLVRLCLETGFDSPTFYYTNRGGIPKLPFLSWQKISFGLLRGRLFSENVAMAARKPVGA